MGASLSFLGLVALNQGDGERATALCTEALALHREMGDRRATGLSLHYLALAMQGQGDHAAARALLAEALALLLEVQDKNNIASCLDALAGMAVAEGAWERAARVFGAAEAIRQAINVPVVYFQRAGYERNVAAVRAQHDAATFVAAWAAGRVMTLEQAIAEALNVTSPVSAQSHPFTPIS